jgi:asparagine synthase (glutamine-hydrolysing)
MCGITGFLELNASDRASREKLARRMENAIAHRGPDDAGVWADADSGLVLAHRRLSIVDLSPEGHQPMVSATGRYVMVYNGEIYNYPELRAAVEAQGLTTPWRGHSDTEVWLACCEAWGIEEALKRANGMFAVAILDRQQRCLVLARDRLGEKPLYYGWQGRTFLFGSELKSLQVHPDFRRRLDARALPLYARFQYVPAPLSIYEGIAKLPPASWVTIDLDASPVMPSPREYWTLPLPSEPAAADEQQLVEELDHLLRDAIRIRMHADVPLGAFLSGGIDSSTIVALAQAQSTRPVRTYSIGFRERDHDESAHARAIATRLGTDHTELFVTSDDALSVVPQLPAIYDEPFSDSSQIPTYLLAKLTRQHVTVSLSGDGGDELFGGYNRYFLGRRILDFNARAPAFVRSGMARLLGAIPGANWDRLLRLGPRSLSVQLGGDRLSKLSRVVDCGDGMKLYKQLVSQWRDLGTLMPGFAEPPTLLDDAALAARAPSWNAWMMYMDQRTYMPDDILVKVDRATMAVALEARVPFLDPRLVEFAARVPLSLKMGRSEGKLLLRKVLYRYLEPALFARPKQGFGVPLAQWLRGPLRDWAEDLLSESALANGVFDARVVRSAWQAHLSGRQSLHYPIWVVLMYQAWARHYRV